jgi:hypothetical protein
MKINKAVNAKRVGQITLRPKNDGLGIEFDGKITKKELTDPTGRVYFIVVNGDIEKIGGSQDRGGIRGTIAAYRSGWRFKMSMRSYCCWKYMRQQLMKGNLVEIYYMLAPMTTARVPTMRGWVEREIATDFHQIEEACLNEFFQSENRYPHLNIQEGGRTWKDTGLLEGWSGMA